MARQPTVKSELTHAITRGRADGRLGPEHRLDVARARQLAEMLTDPDTPRSAVAALDRRFDVVLMRLGLVAPAAGPSDLESWLESVLAETVPDDDDPELAGDADPGAGSPPPG